MPSDPSPDDRVKDSPVGPGLITEWTDAGFPRVNGVAVSWCVLEDGRVFDPRGVMESQRRANAR